MNENDLLLRAKVERDEIFDRYDKGFLEDTAFDVYQRADRYAKKIHYLSSAFNFDNEMQIKSGH